MIDYHNINNLAKNLISAVYHLRAIRRDASPKFIELCKTENMDYKTNMAAVTLRFAIEMKIFTLEL